MPVVKVPAAKVRVMADAVVAAPDVTTAITGTGGASVEYVCKKRSIVTLGHAVAQWIVVPDAPLVPLMYK